MGPVSQRRFIQETERYLTAVTQEAQLREKRTILDLASYNVLRRQNSGAPYSFELFGYLFGVDLPDEVYNHPVMREMYFAAVDMICWANVRTGASELYDAYRLPQDVYSYKVEVQGGLEGNNVLSVLRKELDITLQDAVDYAGAHFKDLVERFEVGKTHMPSFGKDIDPIVLSVVSLRFVAIFFADFYPGNFIL